MLIYVPNNDLPPPIYKVIVNSSLSVELLEHRNFDIEITRKSEIRKRNGFSNSTKLTRCTVMVCYSDF